METKQIVALIIAIALVALIVYRTLPWGRKQKADKKSETK